uniref:Translocation and assembly module TamB C-terminal domain-containing protein n=1 Tax=Candidatus Aschnera chinzeii TaxID=1485666 RepID=A0AAT9G496_9ENTR|nr:MAG: hypothetical protein ACHINZ_2040 [Candidatus Aschnera chinzeii]
MKLIKYINFMMLITMLIISLFTYWITTTESGMQFTIKSINYLKPNLYIKKITGNWNDFTLYNIKYCNDYINLKANKIHIALHVRYLKTFQLYVNIFDTEDLKIKINLNDIVLLRQQNKNIIFSIMQMFSNIILNNIKFRNVNLQIDNYKINFFELLSSISWKDNIFFLDYLNMQHIFFNILKKFPFDITSVKKKIFLINGIKRHNILNKILKISFNKNDFLKLNNFITKINNNFKKIENNDFYTDTNHISYIRNLMVKQVKYVNKKINIKDINIITTDMSVNFTGNIDLLKHMSLVINIINIKNNSFYQTIKLFSTGNMLKNYFLNIQCNGILNGTINTKLVISKSGMLQHIICISNNISIFYKKKGYLLIKNIFLSYKKNKKQTFFILKTNFLYNNKPSVLFDINLIGKKNHLIMHYFYLQTQNILVQFNGKIFFANKIYYRFTSSISAINRLYYNVQPVFDLYSKINFTGSMNYFSAKKLFFFDVYSYGNFGKHILCIKGRVIEKSPGYWKIAKIYFSLNNNTILIVGVINKNFQLYGKINITDFSDLYSNIYGSINGYFSLNGSYHAPRIFSNIIGFNLKLKRNDIYMNYFNFKINIDFLKNISTNIKLIVNGLTKENLNIKNIAINIVGTQKIHLFKLDINDKVIQARVILQGYFNYNQNMWHGVIKTAFVKTPLGKWRINHFPIIQYFYYKNIIKISPHCWISDDSSICVLKENQFGTLGKVNIYLHHFNLKYINIFLKQKINFQGYINSNLFMSWINNQQIPTIRFTITSKDIKINKFIHEFQLPIVFLSSNLRLNIIDDQIIFNGIIQTNNHGRFLGNFIISDITKSKKLSGKFIINNILLELIRKTIKQECILNSILNGHLKLSGSLKNPILNGNLQISHINSKVKWLPFDINNGFLNLSFLGNTSIITGYSDTSIGMINIFSHSRFNNLNNWNINLTINSNHLKLKLLPSIYLESNSNVTFKLTPNVLYLGGNINIFESKIKIKQMPESIFNISSDEIIIDKSHHIEESNNFFVPKIISDLKITIGKNVYLDAFGIKSKLNGLLKVVQDKHNLGLNGQLNVLQGRLNVYGQDLIIRQGQILFTGSMTQPILNIEAIRNVKQTNDGVIAGIKVIGTIDEPKITIFSEPSKSQEETLSYLLKGEGLNAGNSDYTSHMTSLLISIGLSKTGKILNNIGKTFGISNLTLETQVINDKSQLFISGNLSNDLQIKYGIGIFNSLSNLIVRYRLMSKLYIEVISGISQSLDLLYHFEF